MQILNSPVNKNKYKKVASGKVSSGALSTGATSNVNKSVSISFVPRVVVIYGALSTSGVEPTDNPSFAYARINHTTMFRESDNMRLQNQLYAIDNGAGQTAQANIPTISYGDKTFNINIATMSGATNVWVWCKWIAYE